MKFLFCGLCVFLFVFTMNINEVSSVPPIRYPDICYIKYIGCPENYKPPPSCLLNPCSYGRFCCYDGCSYQCSRKYDFNDIP
ncbi:UNVERIFIED_CONTAM: hypothetical protein RMT77_019027 [Armadillidium vulgare]